jgi:hypothetical protein
MLRNPFPLFNLYINCHFANLADFYPEDGGNIFIRKVDTFLSDYNTAVTLQHEVHASSYAAEEVTN